MTPFATADGRLVTGQNPYSTKAVTAKIIEALHHL
jgi:putative intracellular protease/amidase